MPFPLIGRKSLFLGLFLILVLLAEPAGACFPSPDPDHYAVLLSAPDGTPLAAKAKVKAPGSEDLGPGELQAHLRYKLRPAGETPKFHDAVSDAVPVAGLKKDAATLLEFDFSEASIPPEAFHLTLKIYYREDAAGVPLLIAEYLPKEVLKETSEILIPALPPLQGSVSVWGPAAFTRGQGKPKTDRVSIPVPDPAGPFTLRLINGAADGKKRVSSATIRLNGREVFKSCELNQRTAELNRQVTLLAGENTLEVKLNSAPGAQLTLELFRLEENGCSAFAVRTFMRKKGKPFAEEETFELSPEFTGPFTLNLFNGDLDGSRRVDSAVITLNGRQIFAPQRFNEQVGVLSQVVSLKERNVLRVELRGAPGDFLSLGITGYDHTPPKVAITRPLEGAVFTANPIAVGGTVDDPAAAVKVNGVEVAVASDGSFLLEGVVLRDGENEIRVGAVDPCGNEGEDRIMVSLLQGSIEGPPLRFCVQLSMPTIAAAPEAEEECRTRAYTVNEGRVTGVVDETAVAVTLNGIELPDGVEVMDQGEIRYAFRDGTSFSARLNIPQEDGAYPFTAAATNKAGARTEKTVTFVRDRVPPGIAITSPRDGWVTNSPVVTVSGTMDDPEGTVRWGWEEPPIPVENGVFTARITLPGEGVNSILFIAVDPIWNQSSAEIFVTLDTTPPQIDIGGLAEGTAVNSQSMNISGAVIDETPEAVTVAVNHGAPQILPLNGAKFSGAVNLISGANTLDFTALDKAGNTNRATRSVCLDIDPPIVGITSPAAGAHVSGMISVSVNATDDLTGIAGVSLLVDGQLRGTLAEPPFAFPLDTSTLAMGAHTIAAVGMDRAGNQAEAAITVSVSRFLIEIVSPADGATVNRSQTILQGKIHNQTGEIGVVVNGVLAEVRGGDFAVVVPLHLGQNMLTATATTAEGLQAQTSVAVAAELPQEMVRLKHYPASGMLKRPANTLEVTFEAEALFEGSAASYSWDLDGDGGMEAAGAEATAVKSYQEPGFFFPKVAVTDSQGNSYEETTFVNVIAREEVEPLLTAKWEGMKTALVSGDIEGALQYFVAPSRDRYRQTFTNLGNERINLLFSTIIEFKIFTLYGRAAGCGAVRLEGGKRYAYPVNFVKDEKGIWKIMGL